MGEGEAPAARRPFRAPPPPAKALIHWPDSFGTRFCITVDTEEEFDWSAPFSRDARSVTAIAAMPEAAERFGGLGAALTALIDHPVATDPAAIDHLRRTVADSGAAIGTQLHPWVNPPFDEALSPTNSFAGNLPPAIEEAKIAELTAAITAAFGPPRIYRAGRYGLGPATLGLLARHGYAIDTSMRARYHYGREHGPDFRAVGNAAFRASPDIVEVPLTTVFTGALRGVGPRLHPMTERLPGALGLLARTGLLSRISLTPEEMPLDDVIAAIAVALGEGTRLLVLSFHSPSLVPGMAPYVRDAADLRSFWRWWDIVLGELARRGVGDVPLADLLATLVGPAGLEPAT